MCLMLDKTGDDHTRKPAVGRVHSDRGHQPGSAGGSRPAFLPGGRDPRRPLDRRAGKREDMGFAVEPFSASLEAPEGMRFLPFSAQTRMSGVDFDGVHIRKGAPDAIYDDSGAGSEPTPSRNDPDSRQGCTQRRHAPGSRSK